MIRRPPRSTLFPNTTLSRPRDEDDQDDRPPGREAERRAPDAGRRHGVAPAIAHDGRDRHARELAEADEQAAHEERIRPDTLVRHAQQDAAVAGDNEGEELAEREDDDVVREAF